MISGFDVWLLFLGLFVLESLRLTAPGSLIFKRRVQPRSRGDEWEASGAPEYPGAERWSWVLGPLLPWGGPVLVAQQFVVAMSATGISANIAANIRCNRAYQYEEIETVVADGAVLRVNGEFVARFDNYRGAVFTAGLIQRLRSLSKDEREREIRTTIRQSLHNPAKLTDLIANFRRHTRIVGLLVNCFWVACIPIFPLALLFLPNDLVLVAAGAVAWILAAGLAVAVPVAKRKLEPNKHQGFPWASLKYLIYPVSAMTAQETLAGNITVDMHPAAVCLALMRGEEATDRCRQLLLHARHPAFFFGGSQPEAKAISEWFASATATEMEAYLQAAAPGVLSIPEPEPVGDEGGSYCPRCRGAFFQAYGECPDCPGVPLKPINSKARAGTPS